MSGRAAKTRHEKSQKKKTPASGPSRRMTAVLCALAALCLLSLFSGEAGDPDLWWHLKTGQFLVQNHRLPVPDPFSYTTASGAPAYPGEPVTRHFNLTHEWLAQAAGYLVWSAAGFPGLILLRALLLAAVCGIAGWLAWRRSRDVYWGLAAAFACAILAVEFTSDRPALVTFLGVALFLAACETRRGLWALPAGMLVWANCHSGFFLGWVVLGAYCAEALWLRRRGQAPQDTRRLLLATGACVLVSGINPNTYGVFRVLGMYRQGALTASLIEWSRPFLWGPPYAFDILLYAAAAVLLWRRRQVRLADALLFLAFGAAALMAFRNLILIAVLAPVLIFGYIPWRRVLPGAAAPFAAALLAGGTLLGLLDGSAFQLRAAEWRYPAGAADFLARHQVGERLFNTYEYGGYLIWRLWPRHSVFIDGRALNESVFREYQKVLYSFGDRPLATPAEREKILQRFGVDAIVMNGFEYNSGTLYTLAVALADPAQTEWRLVYADPQAMVFLRRPPDGMAVLQNARVWDSLEAACKLHVAHEPDLPLCARSLAFVSLRMGQRDRARRALALYLEHRPGPDPWAQKTYRDLLLR